MAVVQVTGQVTTDVVKPIQRSAVWIKRNWGDDWIYVPYLFCDFAVEESGDGNPHAQFTFNYGSIMQHDRTSFTIYTTLLIQGWFIKVESYSRFGAWKPWIGMIEGESLGEFSVNTAESVRVGEPFLYGNQTFGAVGVEKLLRRRRINGSFGPAGDLIDRVIVFNRRYDRGAAFEGNRSTSRDSFGVFTFSTDGEIWTYRDILEYVIDKFSPAGFTFALWGLIDHLNQFTGTFDFEGVRVWDVLNTLIDSRRGFGWRILTTGEGTIGIYIFSTLRDPIAFGGFTIPANVWQDVPIFDDLIDTHPQLQVSNAHFFETVIVRGARFKTCMTVSPINTTLEPAWTAAEEVAYEAATDKERTTDKHQRVFTTYRIPTDWDWTYLSLFDTSSQVGNPVVRFDGTVDITSQAVFFNQGHRFLSYLPFTVETADSEAEPEQVKPFVLVENPETPNDYHFSESLSPQPMEKSSYRLRNTQREFGLVIKARINHQAGLDTFDESAEPTDFPPEIDYRRMVATVNFETDAHLQVKMAIASGQATGRGDDLLINVPDAQFWYVAPGTIKDITDGAIVYNNGGAAEALRDDGGKLRAIAAAAQAWYGLARNVIAYRHDGIAPFHPVGMMIRGTANTAFEFADVGTVVTRRRWDFRTTQMFVETGFSGFDVGAAGTTQASGQGATPDGFRGGQADEAPGLDFGSALRGSQLQRGPAINFGQGLQGSQLQAGPELQFGRGR